MSKCESCGSELKPGAQFCESCGAPVTAAQASAPQAEPIPNPAPQYEEKPAEDLDPDDYGLAPESPKKKKAKLIIGIVVLVVLVIAAAALGLGKGKYADSPYVGTWNATGYESGGIELSVEEIGASKMVLKGDGHVEIWFMGTDDKDKGEGYWKPTDKGIEITDDSDTKMTGTYSGGVIALEYSGITMNFEKAGGSAAKTGTASSAAPAAASPAASAAGSTAKVADGDSYSADFCGYWVCDGMYGDNDKIVSEVNGKAYSELYKYELKADRSAVIYYEGTVTTGTWQNTGNSCTVHDGGNNYYLELCDDHSQMNEYEDEAQFRYSKQNGHITAQAS